MKESIDIYGLWPAISSLWPWPGLGHLNSEHLSALFISMMFVILLVFVVIVFWSRRKISKRIKALNGKIEGASRRQSIKEEGLLVSHLWREFNETLIEVDSVDAEGNKSQSLYNTIDSNHFFNTSTLAAELTENRMLAAVPGFLTGIGVLGTFIGLQLGLSELNIGNDVAVEEMKSGLAHVISGAKIAFLTSVWGVGLSLIFNFFEKFIERGVREKIKKIQSKVDEKYPRLTPEKQLQQIAEHNAEMRESLQHLGEKIGDRLQSAISDLGDAITKPITDLAVGTGDANKSVLDSLIKEFLEQFKKVGGDQAAEMKEANERFAIALNSLDSSMAMLLKQLEENQGRNADREKELMENMSNKVDELVEKSNAQHKILAEFVDKTLSDIGEGEAARNESTNSLLKRMEQTMQNQLDASGQLINQGKALQKGIDESIESNVAASVSMKTTASELNQASQHMKGTGQSIERVGSSLSGAINQAVVSTANLAQENQTTVSLLNNQQESLNLHQQRMNDTVTKINDLFAQAENSFDIMNERQSAFLKGLADHVNELSDVMSDNFDEYATGLSAATKGQLAEWVKGTTDYTTAMTGAINSLNTVVDEIDGKLSVGR